MGAGPRHFGVGGDGMSISVKFGVYVSFSRLDRPVEHHEENKREIEETPRPSPSSQRRASNTLRFRHSSPGFGTSSSPRLFHAVMTCFRAMA